MSNIDELINGIDSTRRNPKNKELWEFIKSSLEQIKQINDGYKKFYEGSEESSPIIKDIEEKYQKIAENFNELFSPDDSGKNQSQILQEKIEEIKKFHAELLTAEKSIDKDIKDSQKHITEFYNFLFGDDEGETREDETKKFIENISEFNNKLFEGEESINSKINGVYQKIMSKYSDLFEAEEGAKSKIDNLDNNIIRINEFNKNLEEKIKPSLDKKQQYLEELEADINTKRVDINSLLSSATLGALTEGYQEAKEEYSIKSETKYHKSLKFKNIFFNLFAFFNNSIFRYSSSAFNYIIFILPLIIICIIFLEPKILEPIFNYEALYGNGTDRLKGWEFLVLKVSISLPMLWVSWFGQRNISQRRRLFEEYNHKLRVVQIYTMFNDNTKTYNLDNKRKLESILLDVIEENPAKYLGKGETMIDSILEKFRLKGFYKELKDEIVEDLKPIIKSTKNFTETQKK